MSTKHKRGMAALDPEAAIATLETWGGQAGQIHDVANRAMRSPAPQPAPKTHGPQDWSAAAERRSVAEPEAPRHRAAHWKTDGMKLTPEDYRRRLAQLGISADGIDLLGGPMGRSELEDTWARENSRQQVDRAGRALDRHRSPEQGGTALEAFDARTATPEQVRQRLERMDIEPDPSVHFRDVGRPLERPPEYAGVGEHASRAATAHAVVSAAIELAERTGQRIDVMRFSEAELEAYKQIRGISGGYEPAR